ncbi:hypothetical protein BC833DRAFT_618691 [Globomyces pollinis-pini]|nr:hypothetical protein BC833DRAFT_618691 [Globomyces pollinis-pini]
MWRFAEKKKKEKSNIKFKKTLIYIATVLVISLLAVSWYIYVKAFRSYYDLRIEFYFLALSISFYPVNVDLYHRIFHSIKRIKFDPVKSAPAKPLAVVNIDPNSKTVA